MEGEERNEGIPEARPLDAEMIHHHLEEVGLRAWRKGADQFLVDFRYDPDSDRQVQARLRVEGKKGNILAFHMTDDRRVDQGRFPDALRLCNAWNSQKMWPQAYLEKPEPEEGQEAEAELLEPASGRLVLDYQAMLAGPITQELVDEMIKAVIGSSWTFWNWAHQDYGI